jgi:hypothetical protein
MSPIKIVERSRMLNLADFMKADVTCTASKMGSDTVGMADFQGYTLIGEYTVPPQQKLALGKRFDPFDPFIGGLFHVELHDVANGDIEGQFKIVFRNASGTKKAVIIVRRSDSMFKAVPTDRGKQVLLKLGVNIPLIWCREDSVVQLYFKPDVDGKIIDYDNSLNILILEVTTINPSEGRTELI